MSAPVKRCRCCRFSPAVSSKRVATHLADMRRSRSALLPDLLVMLGEIVAASASGMCHECWRHSVGLAVVPADLATGASR